MSVSALPPQEQLRAWLEAIHVDAGFTCCARSDNGQPKNVPWVNSFHADLESLQRHVWRVANDPKGYNVYVTPACFDSQRRATDAVHAIRALYIDVDIHQDAQHYHDQNEAHQALRAVLTAAGYPPPNLCVATGHGLQYLWSFTSALNPDEWGRKMSYLHQLLKGNYKFDSAVTVDIARVLRPPGVTNNKVAGAPVPTKLLAKLPAYAPSMLPDGASVSRVFRASSSAGNGHPFGIMPPVGSKAYAASVRSPVLQATVQNVAAPVGQIQYPPVDMAAVCNGCQIMRGIYRTHGADLTGEPQWRGCLQLAAFVENGDYWAHELVRGNAYYDEASNQAKYEQVLRDKDAGKISGPHVCTTMEQIFTSWTVPRPGIWGELEGPSRPIDPCEGCVFRGHVTTPLQTGHAFAPVVENIVTRVSPPGLFLKLTDPTTNAIEYKPIASWGITNCQLAEHTNPAEGSYLLFDAVTHKKECSKVKLDLNKMSSTMESNRQLASSSLDAPQDSKAKVMLSTLQNIRGEKRRGRSDVAVLHHMGWTTDNRGFAIGKQLFLEDRTTQPVIYTSTEATIIDKYMPAGDPTVWQKAATLFCADHRPEVHALITAAFTSPLAGLAHHNNMLTSFYSAGSGVGKTTLMRLSGSVWGSRDTVLVGNATVTAVQATLKQLYSLPLLWDEFARGSTDTQKDMVDLLFRFMDGQERARGTITGGLQASGSWRTMMMVSGNYSVLHLMPQTGNDEAGMVRVLEFEMPTLVDQVDTSLTLGVFEENYGWGGRLMVMNILPRRAVVRAMMEEERKTLILRFGDVASHRYLYSTGSAMLTTAKIVAGTKILPVRYDLVRTAVEQSIERSMSSVVSHKSAHSVLNLLTRFLNEMSARTIVLPTTGGQQVMGTQLTYHPPRDDRRAVVAEQNQNTGQIKASRAEFERWLRAQGVVAAPVMHDLKNDPSIIMAQVVLGDMTPFKTGRIEAVIVPRALVGF